MLESLLSLFNTGCSAGGPGGEFVKKNDCSCESYNQIYECTIFGRGATVWRGSAFNCPDTNDEIIVFQSTNTLSHLNCNDGAITARIIRVESTSYTSQLTVNVSGDIIGQSISCAYESGVGVPTEIGSAMLVINSGC